MNIISAVEITKEYASHKALDGVTIEIPKGSIYGLLGPNGAGKTTFLRIINGITAPDSGKLLFNGHPLTRDDIYSIGYLPEERGLYKKMKVGEQALYLSRLKGLSRHDAMKSLNYWFKRFEIEHWWNKKVEELSKGMAQKVQFIITVIHNPELLIFDEPFSGFDPINAAVLKEHILERHRQGSTIIFSTHNMASVEEICDHITLINKSKNILSGRVDEIRRRGDVNKFKIEFSGSVETLVAALDSKYEILESKDSEIIVKLPTGDNTHNLISEVNNLVDIHNFVELIPSMNDIFIKTVQQ